MGRAVTSILGQASYTLMQSNEGKDSKKLYNVMRLCDFLDLYVAGNDYIDCLKVQDREKMLMIKEGITSEEGYNLFLKLNSRLDNFQEIKSNSIEKTNQLLDNSVMKVIASYI